MCQSYLNKYEDAISSLTKSIELNPKYGMAYFYRGTFNYQLDNKEEACRDLKKSEELGIKAQPSMDEYCK
ncbi:hypothetical protein EVD19_00920 [Elizabethkingia meningoseptica]|nr:hypothetical protein EVD19_00920 [Elizabethkingia meningoseptica]